MKHVWVRTPEWDGTKRERFACRCGVWGWRMKNPKKSILILPDINAYKTPKKHLPTLNWMTGKCEPDEKAPGPGRFDLLEID